MLFPWATREYLLWEMSLGMIIMYYNIAMEIKYPKPEKEKTSMANMSPEELKRIREELHATYGQIG